MANQMANEIQLVCQTQKEKKENECHINKNVKPYVLRDKQVNAL